MFEDLVKRKYKKKFEIAEFPEGFVKNCLLKPNGKSDYMFFMDCNGVITPYLDGYAIIPIEEYNELQN